MTKDTDAATAGSSDSSSSRPPPLNTTVHNALSSPSSAPLGRASKSLSPAVSAFQFKPVHHTLSPCRSLEMTSSQRSLSSEGVQSASPSSRDLRRSQSNHAMRAAAASSSSSLSTSPRVQTVIQDGYVYKDEVIILDKEKKEELLKVGEITLQSEWTFWYDRYVPNLSAAEYEANLQVISTVGTVQKFWSVYNNIDGPDQLGFRSNLHFMRKGIKPIWEDPQNEHGGSYNFKISKSYSPFVWRDLLVLLIGEKVEGWLGDTVCGVSVSSRQQSDNYQIWTAHTHQNDPEGDARVRSKLSELLHPAEIQSFYYKVHKNHAAFQKPQQSSNKWPDDPARLLLKKPLDMRQKITEENIERVVADIERLTLKHKSSRQFHHNHHSTNTSSSNNNTSTSHQ